MKVGQTGARRGLTDPGGATLLERDFPFREVSLIAKADRRAIDPIYGVHRWWARRPPSVLRAILLAAAQPYDDDVDLERFWGAYASPRPHLCGWRVHDPFIGGGSTLVEAARLGAAVSGGDVDPLAVEIVRYELSPALPDAIREAGAELLTHVRAICGHLYPAKGAGHPLHYFWLHEVRCPGCNEPGLLYRDLVIARDRRKPGAVVRNHPLVVFCPEDLGIVNLNSAERVEFRQSGRRWRIDDGTFVRNRYRCPHCSRGSTHKELATGRAPRRLLAVEETATGEHRTIRSPSPSDVAGIAAASRWIKANAKTLPLPEIDFATERQDDRPRSYGVNRVVELFTDRQLAVLGTAFAWVRDADLKPEVRAGLRLAVSNALATNNKLCSYAYDYGRLSALFSVRGYSLPALPVELNPLHESAGRGTLHQCIERVARAGAASSRRHVWSMSSKRVEAASLKLCVGADLTHVGLVSAMSAPSAVPVADLCVFDPPYFDYIAYSELSEFYRAWLDVSGAPTAPLLADGADPGESFGLALGVSLRSVLARLAPGRPLAFTYHSTNPEAWRAIGIALDEAKIRISALFPVYSDGHMGHHSHPGNCEWDLVIVCRRGTETIPAKFTGGVGVWAKKLKPLSIGKADRTSMKLAISIASPRFGNPAKEP